MRHLPAIQIFWRWAERCGQGTFSTHLSRLVHTLRFASISSLDPYLANLKGTFFVHLFRGPSTRCAVRRSRLTRARRAGRAWMTSHATAIPTRVFWEQQDSSLIRYPHSGHPNFGQRLQNFARTNPVFPYGPNAGESIFDPRPMHAAPPNLPLTGNGCVDILAIIQPHVSTKDRTPAGRLAHKISNWATNLVAGDGISYEKDTADGRGRGYPLPPNAGPLWHGPRPLVQPANGVPIGQVLTALRTRTLLHPVLAS